MEADIEQVAPDLDRLTKQIDGHQITAVIYATIKVGVIDGLAARPRDPEELARDLKVSAPHLTRLLRAAAALGLCCEEPSGLFALAPAAHDLRRESSSPLRERTLMAVEQYWSPWASLAHSVKTGRPAFEQVHGKSPWQWRDDNAAAAALFKAWSAKETRAFGELLAENLDLTAASRLADTGGGGALLSALLVRNPSLLGILFDRPGVIEEARRQPVDPEATGRLETVPGDFFVDVPVSADVFLLKSVLHDWDDDEARLILENCRRAMKLEGRLFVIERALPERGTDDVAVRLLNIHMMAVTGGRERSLDEMANLLESAGFELAGAVRSIAGFAVVEACPR